VSGASRSKDAAPAHAAIPKRRRPPIIVLAIFGGVLAGTYGHFALTMRFSPPLVMLGLGGLTLVLGAAALWRVVDPLTRGERAAVVESRAPYRIRELEREKAAVLKAIKEIELDFQMRKISEADYREMAERYRARALRIMGDLAAGDDYRTLIERELKDRLAVRAAATSHAAEDPAAAPAVAATVAIVDDGTCGTCGTANDPDARFCKRCGKSMTSSGATE
jgi:hypothetical protein